MTDQTAASRQAKRRTLQAEQGVRQLNVMVPDAAHPVLKDIAARLRAGEPLVNTLARAFHKAKGPGHDRGLVQNTRPDLAVPDDLQPGPGEVAVAVRLVKHSSGGLRRWIAGTGLVRRDDVSGWAGVLSPGTVAELRRRVEAAGGTVVERAG